MAVQAFNGPGRASSWMDTFSGVRPDGSLHGPTVPTVKVAAGRSFTVGYRETVPSGSYLATVSRSWLVSLRH